MSLAAKLWNKLSNNHVQDSLEQVEIDTASLSSSGSIVSVNGTSNISNTFAGGVYTLPPHNPNSMQCNCGSCTSSGSLAGLLGTLGGATTGTSTWITSSTPPAPALTPTEAAELESLRQDRAAESKKLKIEEFKKLPPDFRQTIVNKLLWKKFVKDSNAKEASMSDREVELQAKQNMQGIYIGGSGLSITSTYPGYLGSNSQVLTVEEGVSLPTGLTETDLVNAHRDACAEEALTGDSTDSK